MAASPREPRPQAHPRTGSQPVRYVPATSETASETPLRDALLALKEASGDLALRRARSRIVQLLSNPVHVFVQRKLAYAEEARDLAQDALLTLLEKASQCRAIEQPQPAQAEKAAWGWAFMVVRRKLLDAHEQRSRQRAMQEELARTADEEEHREEDVQGALEELLTMAERGALRLIETRQPEDLYRDARASEVAATAEKVSRDIDSFRQVKLLGRRCLEVGLERGCEGPPPRIQNLVAKQVERGKKALHYGALAAAREAEAAAGEALEQLARGLLRLGKAQ